MKIGAYVFFIFAYWFCGFSGAAVQGENRVSDLTIKIIHISAPSKIDLRIENVSKGTIRIWKESNSWGAGHWRVVVIRNGQIVTFYQTPDQSFTRNMPRFDEVKAQGYIEKMLDLSARDWCSTNDTRPSVESGDLVVVVYDVPRTLAWTGAPVTVQARDMRVWYGIAVGSATLP